MSYREKIQEVIGKHKGLKDNLSRENLIKEVLSRKEAVASATGAIAVWTPSESTGRSPKDTYVVKRPTVDKNIDWDSPNNIPMDPQTFDMLFEDALKTLGTTKEIFLTTRAIGASGDYSLQVKTVSNQAITALFTDNVFRPVPKDIKNSIFYPNEFTILVCPYDKLDRSKYDGKLRMENTSKKLTSNMAIAMDFENLIGIVYGSAYCGSVKKLMFTVMDYLLPQKGILPLHCSANEGKRGDVALMLGLSGTGKTSLSSDPERALLGDDEHGWDDKGIANFEYGCYAKMINLHPVKEKEIYDAIMHTASPEKHGAIVENAMIYPNGVFDFNDGRYTENSRGSYPLSFLKNIKESSVGGHPQAILFLTADANGVLPPVAKLSRNQAMLWFMMGYTSKLAGTETGIVEPQSTFSRFFGGPFMPCNPDVYAKMLGEKMDKFKTQVYLINTGWSGGAYGTGKRMDIQLTRAMVSAAISGELEKVSYVKDERFHLAVPTSCPGVNDSSILSPKNTWSDKQAYDERANKLAQEFKSNFIKSYGNKNIEPAIKAECPGF